MARKRYTPPKNKHRNTPKNTGKPRNTNKPQKAEPEKKKTQDKPKHTNSSKSSSSNGHRNTPQNTGKARTASSKSSSKPSTKKPASSRPRQTNRRDTRRPAQYSRGNERRQGAHRAGDTDQVKKVRDLNEGLFYRPLQSYGYHTVKNAADLAAGGSKWAYGARDNNRGKNGNHAPTTRGDRDNKAKTEARVKWAEEERKRQEERKKKYQPSKKTGTSKADEYASGSTEVSKKMEEKQDKVLNKGAKALGLSDQKKYDIPDIPIVNKFLPSTKQTQEGLKAEFDKNVDKAKKENDKYFNEMDEYARKQGISDDTMLENGMTYGEYRKQLVDKANKELDNAKHRAYLDIAKEGKVSATDIYKGANILADELADYLIPMGGTAKGFIKTAEGILKATKGAKAGKVLTEATEDGLKVLTKSGKRKVQKKAYEELAKKEKQFEELERSGKKTIDEVNEMRSKAYKETFGNARKSILKDSTKQNIKKELLANAMQDATLGTTIDALKGKQQGLEGEEFRNYMLENAAMNAVFGAPISAVAGKTSKAAKISLANETAKMINEGLATVGGATKADLKELLALTQKAKAMNRINPETHKPMGQLTAHEEERIAQLTNKVVNKASGIAQVDSKGRIVVNDKGVAKDILSKRELDDYVEINSKIKTGVTVSPAERGRFLEYSSRMDGAYKAVESNARASIEYAKRGYAVSLDAMDSAVNFRTKMGGTKAQIKEAKDARTQSAMKLFDVDRKTAEVITTTGERTNGKLSIRPMTEWEAQNTHGFPKTHDFEGLRFIKNNGSDEQVIYFNPESITKERAIFHEVGHFVTSNDSTFVDTIKKFAGDDWEEEAKNVKDIYGSLEENMLEENGLSANVKYDEETACNLLAKYGDEGKINLMAFIAGENETLFGKMRTHLKKIFASDSTYKNDPTLNKLYEQVEEAYEATKHPRIDDVIMTTMMRGASDEDFAVAGMKSFREEVDPKDFVFAKNPKALMEHRNEMVKTLDFSYNIAEKRMKEAFRNYIQTKDNDAFRKAKLEIFKDTGWFRSYDGMWGYWFRDGGMKFELANKFKLVEVGRRMLPDGAVDNYAKAALYGKNRVIFKGEYDAPLVYFNSNSRELEFASADVVKKYEQRLIELDEERLKTKSKTFRAGKKKEYEKLQREVSKYKLATDGIELGKIIEHDDFFALYPEAMSIKVKFGSTKDTGRYVDAKSSVVGERVTRGHFNPLTREITLNPYLFFSDSNLVKFAMQDGISQDQLIKRVLIHEMQHSVQLHEGFAGGGAEKIFTYAAKDNEYPKNYWDSQELLGYITDKTQAMQAMEKIDSAEADQFKLLYQEIIDDYSLNNQLNIDPNAGSPDPYDLIIQELSTSKLSTPEQNERFAMFIFDEVTDKNVFDKDAINPPSKKFEDNMIAYILADIKSARIAERDEAKLYASLAGEKQANDVADQIYLRGDQADARDDAIKRLGDIKEKVKLDAAALSNKKIDTDFQETRERFIEFNETYGGTVAVKKRFSTRDEYIDYFTKNISGDIKPYWDEYIGAMYDYVGTPQFGKIRGQSQRPEVPITEGENVRLADIAIEMTDPVLDGKRISSAHPIFNKKISQKYQNPNITPEGESTFSTSGRKKSKYWDDFESGKTTWEEYLAKAKHNVHGDENTQRRNVGKIVSKSNAEEKPTVVDGVSGAYKGDTSGHDFLSDLDEQYYSSMIRQHEAEVEADSVAQPPAEEVQKQGASKEVREQTVGGEQITDKQLEQFPLAQEVMAKMRVGVYIPQELQGKTIRATRADRGFDPENSVLKLRKSMTSKSGEVPTVNSLYNELSAKYPELFPAEIKATAERFDRLLEVSNLQGGVVKGKRGSYYLPQSRGGTPSVKKYNLNDVEEAPKEQPKGQPKEQPQKQTTENADDFDDYDMDGTPVETPKEEPQLRPAHHKDFLDRARRTYSKEDMNETAIHEYQKVFEEYGGEDEFRKIFDDEVGKGAFGKLKGTKREEADGIAKEEFDSLGYEEMRKQVLQSDVISQDPNVFMAKCNVLQNEIDRMLKSGEGDRAQLFSDKAEIYEKLSGVSTWTSNTLNALKRFATATPKGRVRTVENEIKRLEKLYKDRIKGGKLKIDEEKLARLGELEKQYEIDDLLDEINQDLWEQIPATLFERLNEYRHCFMLFNPKTHGRNLIGNGIFRFCRKLSDEMEAGMLNSKWATSRLADIQNISKDDVIVDKVHVSKKDEIKPNNMFLYNEFRSVYDKSGSRNKFIEMGRPDGVDTVRWKAMQKLINANYGLLEKEDLKGALIPAFNKAYTSWCKARCVKELGADKYSPEALQEFMHNMSEADRKKARHYALAEGEYATFRDTCAFSDWLIGKKQMFAGKKGKTSWGTFGYRVLDTALEGAIPFVKTPVNIFRRSVDFSPVSFVPAFMNIAKAENADMFKQGIHQLCTGLTGTGIMGIGVLCASQGLVTVKAGEESGDAYYDRDMGYQDYSLKLNLGGKEVSMTLDWAQPMQASFFMGASFFDALKNSKTEDGWEWDDQSIINAFFAITSPMTDTSFMSSPKDTVQRFLERATRTDTGETDFPSAMVQLLAGDIPKNYVSGFAPQLTAQLAGVLDDNQRDTRGTSANSFIRGWQSAGRQLINKVPVLRQYVLNPKINRKGEDVQNDENMTVRIAKSFLMPMNVKEITKDKYDQELINIRNNIEDKSSKEYRYFFYNLTGNPPYSLVNGKQMTYDEAYKYGKVSRKQQNEMIKTMVDADSYDRMNNKMKSKEVSEAYWIAKAKADMDTYSASYAIKALKSGDQSGFEADAFKDYKRQMKDVYKTEEISKKYMNYYINKEKLVLRSHATGDDVYKLKALVTIQSGDKVLREALDINDNHIKDMKKYWKLVMDDGGTKKESKATAFKELTDGCCSIMSHIKKADIDNPSKGLKSTSAGIEAANNRQISERVYRAYGHNWNSAQSGAGLMMKYNDDGKYSIDKIQSMRKKIKGMKKAEVVEYINKQDCKNDDERACLFEVLYSQGQYKNPFKSQVDDHLKWGDNRDDEWETGTGGGSGRGGRRRGGGGGGSGSGSGGGSISAKAPERKTSSGKKQGFKKVYDGYAKGGAKPNMVKATSGAIGNGEGSSLGGFDVGSFKSNINEAYRKKAKKLRENLY